MRSELFSELWLVCSEAKGKAFVLLPPRRARTAAASGSATGTSSNTTWHRKSAIVRVSAGIAGPNARRARAALAA